MSVLSPEMYAAGEAFAAEHPNACAQLDAYAKANAPQPEQAENSLSAMQEEEEFPFFTVYDFDKLPPMDWSLKGLLPRRGIGQLFGESGAGKSFIALDLVWHLAEGRDWFGWKYKRHSSGELPQIFYVCLEGGAGFRNRVQGIKARWYDKENRLFPCNLKTSYRDFFIMDESSFSALVRKVNAEKGKCPPFVVVDTQAQAAPDVNENSSEDMGPLMSQVGRLAKETDGFVLMVSHAGKNLDLGARGWSGQKGPCDVHLEVRKGGADGVRTLTAAKVKDGQDGISHDFRLLSVPLGHDEDEDPVSTYTVEPVTLNAPKPGRGRAALGKSECFALECFNAVRGEELRAVTDEEWRAEYFKRSTYSTEKSKSSAFNRDKRTLREKGVLLCVNNVYTLETDMFEFAHATAETGKHPI